MQGSKTTAEVVELQDSSEVKLGVKCLIPDDDYVSAEVLRARATERFVQESEYMERESAGGGNIYRRARASAPQERVLEYAYRPAQIMVPPPPPRTAPRTMTLTSNEQTKVTMDSNAATMGQISTSRVESPTLVTPMPTQIASPTKLKRADSVKEVTEGRRSSRSRHSHRTSIVIEAYKPERTEIEIRRLARDEVERYRQAERLMEAHGDVYTHGKLVAVEAAPPEPEPIALVPVERRIALEKDVVDRPWIKSPERPRPLEFASAYRRERSQTGPEEAIESLPAPWRPLRASEFRRRRSRSRYRRELGEDAYVWRRDAIHSGADMTRENARREDASSDKTRWPGTSKPRRAKVAENPTRYETTEVEEAAQQYKDSDADERFKNAERRSAKFAEDMREVRSARDLSSTQQADVASSSSGRWTDREYWLDGQPAQAAVDRPSRTAKVRVEGPPVSARTERLILERQPPANGSIPREPMPAPREQVAASSSRRMRHSITERTATNVLPYPAEESIVSAQMPSPKPPVSKAKINKPAKEDEGEYTFVKRTVKHTRSTSRPGREKPYYEVHETFGRRSKPAADETKPQKEVEVNVRRKDDNQRTSDISSRVHFAKQVEFSPTPPGSDASSTQFRKLGRMRRDLGVGETGGDLIAEYERRGRARSRLPYEGYDYEFKRKSVTAQQPIPRAATEMDRDRTVRPPKREASALLVNNMPFARARSESPSRETAPLMAKKQKKKQRVSQRDTQKEDGFGPYRTEERRDDSMAVEDGRSRISSNSGSRSSSSSSSGYRYVRRDEVRRGPR